MTTISQALTSGRRAMARMEPALVANLLEQYGIAWQAVERELTRVEGIIEAAIARGETVDDAWLLRQQWWASTLDSIEVQMARYTQGMAQTMQVGQLQAVQTSHQVSSMVSQYLTRAAVKRGVTVAAGIQGQVNAGAFERWVVAQQPGSPIRAAIDAYGERVSEAIRKHMTEGLAKGESSRAIAQEITAEVGPDAVRGRIHTLTRTEIHRAYRGNLRDQMEALGPDVVSGWRWLAALGKRTCPACLAMHGKEFAFDQYPDQFHVACRCTIQPFANPALIPRRAPGQTGEEWLRTQPVAVQRGVLRTKDRYDAFRQGTPLDDFVTVTHDDTWGDSIALKPSGKAVA